MSDDKICFACDDPDIDVVVKIIWTKEGKNQGIAKDQQYSCDNCLISLIEGGWTGGGPFLCDVKKIIVLKEKRGRGHV